jgi:hypothetical protein
MSLKDNPKLVIGVLAIVVVTIAGILLMESADAGGETDRQQRTREAAEAALEAMEGSP